MRYREVHETGKEMGMTVGKGKKKQSSTRKNKDRRTLYAKGNQ